MAEQTRIQWCDATWNIARGCSKVDEDCKNCYIDRESYGGARFNPLQVVRTKTVFNFPLKYKKTKSDCWDGAPLIFTSSLTDWGHVAIDSYRHEMFAIINKRPDLIFQLLTKRIERGPHILPPDWGSGYDNVWLGTSAGGEKSMHRFHELVKTPAKTRFISFEPLHAPITTDLRSAGLDEMHWVIIGGESGDETGKHGYRPCKLSWMESILNQCVDAGVPVFVKQMGTHLYHELKLSDRHGGNINEFPTHLRIRNYPLPNLVKQ